MKYLLMILIIFFGANAFSAEDMWTEKVKVLEIYTGYKEGHFLFRTSGTRLNPAECTDNNLYSVESDNTNVQSILSVLLSAKIAGTDVKVAVDGDRCGTVGVNNLANMISVSRVGIF